MTAYSVETADSSKAIASDCTRIHISHQMYATSEFGTLETKLFAAMPPVAFHVESKADLLCA